MWTPARSRLNAIEDRLNSAEARMFAIDARQVAAGQGLYELETFGSGAYGTGSIYNGNGVGVGPIVDCRTFTISGQGCASPVLLPGASIAVYAPNYLGYYSPFEAPFSPLVAFTLTDANGAANVCLVDGQLYLAIIGKVGHNPAYIPDVWPFASGLRTITLGYPSNFLCWSGCNDPVRIDMLLTSKFGSFRLGFNDDSYIVSGGQTGTGTITTEDCLGLTPGGHYAIQWGLIAGTAAGTYALQATITAVHCGAIWRPFNFATFFNPATVVSRTVTVQPSSYTCSPTIATYDFSGFPEIMAGVGSFSVTLDGT